MAETFYVATELLERPIKVLLIGVGGTGGEVLDGLCKLHHALKGVGHPSGLEVVVADGDAVSPSNIGRQRFSPIDIGAKKASLLVNRINLFYGLPWKACDFAIDCEDHADEILGFDLVLTCVDKAAFRVELAALGREIESDVLWIDFGNLEFHGQIVAGHLSAHTESHALRLPNVVDLYPELASVNDDDKPSCSLEQALHSQDLFVNRWVADAGLALLWQLLRRGQLTHHGAWVNVQQGSVVPIPIDPKQWQLMGYRAAVGPRRSPRFEVLSVGD